MSGAYYNEIEPFAAQWLRNLIAAGHIAAGDVDERSIVDVTPSDLAGYTQCHFFAGIGVWSYALRLAGWSDDRPIWTGSCPCQPFSAAGKGKGFDDERHLWPAFGWLIGECRPAVVAGEQVASKDAEPWIDLVQADMEALGYRFGAVPFPSAGVGAPHIRDRLYWLADATGERYDRRRSGETSSRGNSSWFQSQGFCTPEWLANNNNQGLEGRWQPGCECAVERAAGSSGLAGGVGYTISERARGNTGVVCSAQGEAQRQGRHSDGSECLGLEHAGSVMATRTGPTHGFWRNADWLACRDGKWRPVEPGTFPLAHGAPARVGRLRAYGNAIVAPLAAEWVRVVMECMP